MVVVVIDGRDGVEEVRGEREVAREEVEGTDECLGVLLLHHLLLPLLFLIYRHCHGGRVPTVSFSL